MSCLPGKSVCRFATSPILLANFLPPPQFRGFRASLVFTTASSNLFKAQIFSHFFSLSRQCFHSSSAAVTPEKSAPISGRSHGLGSTVGGARAASLNGRTSCVHRFLWTDNFLAGEITGSSDIEQNLRRGNFMKQTLLDYFVMRL